MRAVRLSLGSFLILGLFGGPAHAAQFAVQCPGTGNLLFNASGGTMGAFLSVAPSTGAQEAGFTPITFSWQNAAGNRVTAIAQNPEIVNLNFAAGAALAYTCSGSAAILDLVSVSPDRPSAVPVTCIILGTGTVYQDLTGSNTTIVATLGNVFNSFGPLTFTYRDAVSGPVSANVLPGSTLALSYTVKNGATVTYSCPAGNVTGTFQIVQ